MVSDTADFLQQLMGQTIRLSPEIDTKLLVI